MPLQTVESFRDTIDRAIELNTDRIVTFSYAHVPSVIPRQKVLDNIGFEKSFKLAILTLTNTVNSEIYSLQNLNFINLLTSSKISLIIFMIIGKIELISIFLIFKKILFRD